MRWLFIILSGRKSGGWRSSSNVRPARICQFKAQIPSHLRTKSKREAKVNDPSLLIWLIMGAFINHPILFTCLAFTLGTYTNSSKISKSYIRRWCYRATHGLCSPGYTCNVCRKINRHWLFTIINVNPAATSGKRYVRLPQQHSTLWQRILSERRKTKFTKPRRKRRNAAKMTRITQLRGRLRKWQDRI